MTDFLDVKRREISDRLKELKPAVDEYGRLQAAASALAKLGGPTPVAAAPTAATVAAPRRRGPGRPRWLRQSGFDQHRDHQSGTQKSRPSPW